jgi:hypothetical protein
LSGAILGCNAGPRQTATRPKAQRQGKAFDEHCYAFFAPLRETFSAPTSAVSVESNAQAELGPGKFRFLWNIAKYLCSMV